MGRLTQRRVELWIPGFAHPKGWTICNIHEFLIETQYTIDINKYLLRLLRKYMARFNYKVEELVAFACVLTLDSVFFYINF